MTVFVDKTQFLISPAFGFVRDAGNICITIAFLWYGISFKLFRISQND